MAAATTPGLLPLAARPATLTRTGRRVARAALFMAETAQRVRREPPTDPRTQARRLSWFSENVCALHGVRLRVSGTVPRGRCVIVANHLGYIDPPALASVVPAVGIAKRELGEWPVIGELMRAHGILLLNREDPYDGVRVLRRVLRVLQEGASVIAFPEGTTTDGADVLPMKRGIFGAARLAGAPVVPVAIRYRPAEACWINDETFMPHYMRTAARPVTTVELRFGPSIVPASAGSPDQLARLARHLIRGMLGVPTRGDEASGRDPHSPSSSSSRR